MRSPSFDKQVTMTIPRKPVGSGISPKQSPTKPTGPHFVWTYDRPVDPANRPNKGIVVQPHARDNGAASGGSKHKGQHHHARRLSAAWETSSDAFHPDELLSCETGATRANGSPGKQSPNMKQRARPIVRFKSESEAGSSSSESISSRDSERMASASSLWMRKRNAQAHVMPTQQAASSLK